MFGGMRPPLHPPSSQALTCIISTTTPVRWGGPPAGGTRDPDRLRRSCHLRPALPLYVTTLPPRIVQPRL